MRAQRTSDGIEQADWDVLHDLALALVNTSDPEEEASTRKRLNDYLGVLTAKYGERPSILATRADYCDDPIEAERLFLQAFELSRASDDRRNMRYIALSLADLYCTEQANRVEASAWLEKARELIGEAHKDDWDEYARIAEEIEELQE